MKFLSPAASVGLVVVACLVTTSVAAQQSGLEPRAEMHGINPSLSLSSPTNSPLQEQMRQDYATSLMGAQRDLLQQNPSGLGRQEQAIGHELNGYVGPR